MTLRIRLLWLLSLSHACLPKGHVDLEPNILCTGAGDGIVACTNKAPAGSIPLAVKSCMNAVMTVIAYRGDRPIQRWEGHIKWTGPIDGDGVYAGAVQRGAIHWQTVAPVGVRVETDEAGNGGVTIERWVSSSATRIVVIVRPGYAAAMAPGATRGASVGATGARPARNPTAAAPEFDTCFAHMSGKRRVHG